MPRSGPGARPPGSARASPRRASPCGGAHALEERPQARSRRPPAVARRRAAQEVHVGAGRLLGRVVLQLPQEGGRVGELTITRRSISSGCCTSPARLELAQQLRDVLHEVLRAVGFHVLRGGGAGVAPQVGRHHPPARRKAGRNVVPRESRFPESRAAAPARAPARPARRHTSRMPCGSSAVKVSISTGLIGSSSTPRSRDARHSIPAGPGPHRHLGDGMRPVMEGQRQVVQPDAVQRREQQQAHVGVLGHELTHHLLGGAQRALGLVPAQLVGLG